MARTAMRAFFFSGDPHGAKNREKENIKMGRPEASDDEMVVAADTAAVHKAILGFEKGYATVVGERGITLSGGQRQRLTLARALLRDPEILVLDDALCSVDTETEAKILQALRQRHGRRTTLLIAHRLSTLMEADRVLVLEEGRVAQLGTHESLLQEEGLYRQVWSIQESGS